MWKIGFWFVISFLAIAPQTSRAEIVRVRANGRNANVETISQVSFDLVQNGTTTLVTQNAPAAKRQSNSAESAWLRSIQIGAGKLTNFRHSAATIRNANFPTGADIEVLSNGQSISLDQTNQFLDALAGVHSSGDLLNYLRVDGTNVTPTWDVMFDSAIDSNSYLVFEERNGNTSFTLEALNANGDVIVDSNQLNFNNRSYQWNLGIANSADPFNSQPQVISVIDLDLFNATEEVSGFRVVNTGRADLKFFTATVAVPEPSCQSLLAGLSVLITRRRLRTI